MDCFMPEMDGFQATQVIRRSGFSDLPIIAVTAGGEELRDQCISAGMNDFITKPITLARIQEAVKQWV